MKEDLRIEEITEINETRMTEALALMNRTQGEGLFNKRYLKNKILDEDSLVLFVLKDSEVICVGCAEIINQFDYYIPFDLNIIFRLKNKKVGSLCTLGVKEEFQGQGIGQEVTKKRMAWLFEKGCHSILGVSWKSGLSHTSDRVFKKMGFHPVSEVEKFFFESSKKDPFDCPGCKKQPCICSAILFEFNY